METSTALLLPRSDFAKQGLRCSSVSQQEGLQAHEASLARSSTWEHLHNPCTDPAAPVPTDHSIPGGPDGMQKELSSQHSIAQPELTHSNPTLHLSTQLAWIKGGAKDFTCAEISRFKMLFSIEDASATPLHTHRTCTASKCFLKTYQPTQKSICTNPSVWRPPALSTASFIALVKS